MIRRTTALATLLGLFLASCGGGGGDGGGGQGDVAQIGFRLLWENDDPVAPAGSDGGSAASFGSQIPASVSAIRFIFSSQSDDDFTPCCVAVIRGSEAFENRRIQLADVPAGEGTLRVDGFPETFAPADGVTRTCPTRDNQGSSCDNSRDRGPSFSSDPAELDLIPNATNQVSVEVYSVPFLVDADPDEDETADAPRPEIEVIVADANHDVTDVRVRLDDGDDVINTTVLESTPCDDDGPQPDCSPGGIFDVSGVILRVRANEVVDEGEAEVRVTAQNTGNPPRSMDERYDIGIPPATTTTTTTTSTSTTEEPTTTTTMPPTTTTSSTVPPTTTTSSTTTTTLPPTTTTTTTLPPVTTTTPPVTTSTFPPTTTTTFPSTTTTLPPQVCVSFFVPNDVDLTGVSFVVDYAEAPGEFTGTGSQVNCFNDVPGAVAAFNDMDETRDLEIAIASSEPFDAPTTLAICTFDPDGDPADSDFDVTVLEATSGDLMPITIDVAPVVSSCEQTLQ